jgi:hypothetical protein
MRLSGCVRVLVCGLLLIHSSFAQSPNGNINGSVQDPASGVIVDAEVVVANDVTGVQYTTKTNSEGIFVLSNLPPGPYRIQVSKLGFKTVIKPDIVLNIQDALSLNFTLPLGAAYEVLTVEGGATLVNTESAAVSTVVDRQFAENLPMNGRSFQTLIYLTPGVVATPTNAADSGQFAVNGQRPSSNYWMVDGVGANIGVGTGYSGNGLGGAAASFSTLGGTNGLVSVDALQEFRIQTSTYAPEFGRTPGGQISIVTRSGTNRFHGTAFNYLRNDIFDANNWFNGYTNSPPLPKAEERQNDFGGTLGGPILKDRTFFFFSYEGLRLRLPQTSLTNVPDSAARQRAVPAMQPYLNAFPVSNGPDIGNGMAQLNKSYSNPSSLDAYSLRLDHRLGSWLTLFARYNYSPSHSDARGGGIGGALSTIALSKISTETATAGGMWAASPTLTNDLRFNYSQVNARSSYVLDNFAGAIPLTSPPYPSPFTNKNANFGFNVFALGTGDFISTGNIVRTLQRQFNLVDTLSWQVRDHRLKLGVDFRRLSPFYEPFQYQQIVAFNDIPSSETGSGASGLVSSVNPVTIAFHNLSAYVQDTWRARPRLSLTYGLRWDLDFSPSSLSGPSIPAVTGYSLTNFSNLSIAPAGTAPFKTTHGNFAPRVGMAYEVSPRPGLETVLRGGVGVFFDLANAETGNLASNQIPPFGNLTSVSGTFPFAPSQIAPVAIPTSPTLANLAVFSPNLELPYALEWNVAVEQSLGKNQTVSLSYVGASGRRLLQTTIFFSPPSTYPPVTNFQSATFIDNTSSSNYDALQVQFHRRLAAGFQALASYAWSHSIDDSSASSFGNHANAGVPGSGGQNRGNSDFDIRNGFTAGLTYELPGPRGGSVVKAILRGWSTETFILARSAPPVNIGDINFFLLPNGNFTQIRPDVVPGQPFYLYGSGFPGGKALNPAAFQDPPTSSSFGVPLRQGDLPRNKLRAFGATQWDFAVHRDFPIWESVKLQFRAEIFNLLNHPNFGPPANTFGLPGFGLSPQTLNQSLSIAGPGIGGFNALYQIGGPRSVQAALKLSF